MCGITACLIYAHHKHQHNKRELEDEVEESLEIVKHRGPDARGKWISRDRRVGR
jgi:asparagine synthase (glutamine-hydrolysing)